MSSKKERRAERQLKVRTAMRVSRALGVSRKNSTLFAAVAAALGKPWTAGVSGGKGTGYDLVMEYASREKLPTLVTSKGRIKARGTVPLPFVATDDFLLTFEWRRLRMIVLKKRGARCECCGASPRDGQTILNVDHVKPRKLFPELALDEVNLQVLCNACNHGKGNWDQTDWRGTA